MPLQQQKRQRGALLTLQGIYRLQQAKQKAEYDENDGKRFTLDILKLRTGLDSHTLCKIFNRTTKVDKKSLAQCFQAFNLMLKSDDYESPTITFTLVQPATSAISVARNGKATELRTSRPCVEDYGFAPDVSAFYGRTAELTTLHQWIKDERCRLILLSGLCGIGKTHLSVKLAQQLQEQFEVVIWRSLHPALPIQTFLQQLIEVFSPSPTLAVPVAFSDLLAQLITYLRSRRCLLILDNFETLLHRCQSQPNAALYCGGCYRPGYEGYSQLLKRIADISHQSCLVLTTREIPLEIRQRQGSHAAVRVLPIQGLQMTASQALLQHQGTFQGTPSDWNQLITYYNGHPSILLIIGRTLQTLFNGKIAQFLNHNPKVFGEICHLFAETFDRLSDAEITLLITLARQNQPVSFAALQARLHPSFSTKTLLEVLESLESRSLLQLSHDAYAIVPILVDYIADRYLIGKPNHVTSSPATILPCREALGFVDQPASVHRP